MIQEKDHYYFNVIMDPPKYPPLLPSQEGNFGLMMRINSIESINLYEGSFKLYLPSLIMEIFPSWEGCDGQCHGRGGFLMWIPEY